MSFGTSLFALPERQAKVNQIVKSLEEDEDLYCICRQRYDDRFMIACDACDEWYHGECVGLTEAESKLIKKYYCGKCKARDARLQIKFRRKYRIENQRGERMEQDDAEAQRIERERQLKRQKKREAREQSRASQLAAQAEAEAAMDIGEPPSPPLAAPPKKEPPRHCYGPGCVYAARHASKYCSDDCGLLLAERRLLDIVPGRLREWHATPCVADKLNEEEIARLGEDIAAARARLTDLDRDEAELRELVARGRRLTAEEGDDPDPVDEESGYGGDVEFSVTCATCGHDVHPKLALKHFERCFIKTEQLTSFGSIYKTRIPGNTMFCDAYNPQMKLYCKKLRAICPEHSKEPKYDADVVCGYPLTSELFEPTGELCRREKRHCSRHHQWERLRQAEIDMERVRTWTKIEELLESERLVKLNLTERANVLALALHRTVDHQPGRPLPVTARGKRVAAAKMPVT